MFSVSARAKMMERGWSVSSLVRFFVDSTVESRENARRHAGAVRSMWWFAAAALAATVAAVAPLYLPGDGPRFARFVLFDAGGCAGFASWASLNAGLLRRLDGTPTGGVGTANFLTLLRFFWIVPVVVLFADRLYVAALVLYLLLGLTDIVDGAVARRGDARTEFGVVMDPLADVFSTVAVFGAFLARGLIPGWLYGILLARYVMLIVGSFLIFLLVGPFRFRSTLPGKVVGIVQATGVATIIVCVLAEPAWLAVVSPGLFPVLGVAFASIIVSQLVIGVRLKRRAAQPRGEVVGVGSQG